MKVEKGIIDYEPVYGVVIKITDREAALLAKLFESREFLTYAKRIREVIENGTDN